MFHEWSYRLPLPEEVIQSVESILDATDLSRATSRQPFKCMLSRYWGAFIHEEIWLGLAHKVFRLRKRDGLLLSTFLVPIDLVAGFEEYCIIPLRPLGPKLLVMAVQGKRDGQDSVLPFALDFSGIEPKFVVLDALEEGSRLEQIDWTLHLTTDISPYQRPLAHEVDVSAVRSVHEFVILNLSDLIDSRKMTLVCDDQKRGKCRSSDVHFLATDNCFGMSLAKKAQGPRTPGRDRPLCKEIASGRERLALDFEERTHLRISYQAPAYLRGS